VRKSSGIVVVTGAAGGIGSATCKRLANDGYSIWALDGRGDELNALVRGLSGSNHRAITLDLLNFHQHDEWLAEIDKTNQTLIGLVHLAAVLRRKSDIFEITEDDWDYQIDINLKATFFLNRSVAKKLIFQGNGGTIVNFTSQGWWSGGFGGSVVYAASKGGIVSMSRGLARSLAPHNIRVNTLAPGFVDTLMMRSGMSEQALAENIKSVPLGRMAESAELADVAAFLVSSDSRYMTGATLNVSGGQLMY
jgi:NAD(P)-dependent dehydrogenase (short-subunit alcohol dehydrogenase family)